MKKKIFTLLSVAVIILSTSVFAGKEDDSSESPVTSTRRKFPNPQDPRSRDLRPLVEEIKTHGSFITVDGEEYKDVSKGDTKSLQYASLEDLYKDIIQICASDTSVTRGNYIPRLSHGRFYKLKEEDKFLFSIAVLYTMPNSANPNAIGTHSYSMVFQKNSN